MVAGARFEENRAGIEAMLASPAMVEAMRHKAELVRIEAERIAPVRTGNYAFATPNQRGNHDGAFHVSAGVDNGRAYGRVSNSATSRGGAVYSVFLEFGTKHMRKQRILGRALDALNRP